MDSRQDMFAADWRLNLPSEGRHHDSGEESRLAPVDYEQAGMIEHTDPLDSPEAINLWKRLMALYSAELDAQDEQRRQMQEDERFYDGEQWDPADASLLRSRGQEPLTFNVIAPSVNWLLGTERRNRVQFKVLPREKHDGAPSRLKTELMKYVDDCNNAEYAVSCAYADAVKVGLGWIEEGWQGDSGEEPVFRRHESWRNMLHDSRGKELDLTDARFVFRVKWSDSDIALKLFPGPRNAAIIQQASASSGDVLGLLVGMGDSPMDEGEDSYLRTAIGANEEGGRPRVRLVEAWYRTIEERPYVAGGQFSGELFDIDSPGHLSDVQKGNSRIAWRTRMSVRVAIFTTSGLLYDQPSPYRHNRFPFTPVWGNRRGSDGMPYGLVRALKDIQRDINKRHSKATHILNSSKVIMDEGAVGDLDEFAEEVARPDAILVKKPGKELTIDHGKELGPAQLDLMSRSIQMIQQTSGVTDEAMGRTTNASSGRAIIARQNQGSIATAHFLDNLRLALRLSGEKQLSLIEQFYTARKAFRITNNRGAAQFMVVNDAEDAESDILRTKADFIIAEDAWRISMRQAQMEELGSLLEQIAPVAPQVVAAILDIYVEAMDLPFREEIVSRIRKITGMTDPDMTDEELKADPEHQAKMQAEAQQAEYARRMAEAELRKVESEAAEREARAGKAGADAAWSQARTVKERISSQDTAIQAAINLLMSAAAAPVADRLMDEAESPTPNRIEQQQIEAAAAAQPPVEPPQDAAPTPAPIMAPA